MKRMISLLWCVLVVVCSLCACGENDDSHGDTKIKCLECGRRVDHTEQKVSCEICGSFKHNREQHVQSCAVCGVFDSSMPPGCELCGSKNHKTGEHK